MRVAVVGATGAVGRSILELLEQRSFPADEVIPLASVRSAGSELRGLRVRELREEELAGVHLALFSAGGSVSGEWAPRFTEAGAIVVDNSSRWRMEPDVPLVVAEVNPQALDAHRGIVANPNCTTMQAMLPLKAIHDAVGLERVILSSYQAVSGTGLAAVEELKAQAHAILHEMEPPAPEVYPHPIAFNVLPQVEHFPENDPYTTEETKVMNESRKILELPGLRITATCVRVPVVTGHSEAINVETHDDLSPEACRELLRAAPGVVVEDDPGAGRYPLAINAVGRDEVFVGRIRRDPSNPRTLNLWVVGDNLRKGAATNTVQLAELLHARGLLDRAPAHAA